MTGTAAGLHLLVRPPTHDDEQELAALAQRRGLDARPLRHYAVARTDQPGLAIGYGHRRPDALAHAVGEVAVALRERRRPAEPVPTQPCRAPGDLPVRG